MVNMKKLIIACLLLSLFSCTRAEKEGATAVTLNLPANWGQEIETKSLIAPQSLNSGIVPASLSELNCFAALVGGGPDAFMNDNVCSYKNTSGDFTVGMVFPGFTNSGASGTQLKFEVPNGKGRTIYLVGFKIETSSVVAAGSSVEKACATLVKDDSLENYISEPYLISSLKGIDMSGGDLPLTMTATLDTSAKIGDCKGPDFINHNSTPASGVPYKFSISFQDGVGGIAKPFGYDKCVGVRFQVQDSSGNRASMSANPTIQARVSMNYLGSSIGTFYHTGGSYGCQAGYEMSSGSSDMTFAFKNAGTAFSDFVAFFSPSSAQTPTGVITISDNGSTDAGGITTTPMISGSTTFYYYPTSTPPTQYAIYDLYNNRTTADTDSSKPMVIKANQCREAYLQFLDVNGVPTRMTLSSGAFRSVDIAPVGTTSNLNFYPSSSDCSISSNDYSTAVIPMSGATNYGAHKFNYKMNIPLTSFSFSAINGSGTSTPAISTGDMSPSSNFWRSENN